VRLSAAHRLANPRRARSSHPRPAGPLLRTLARTTSSPNGFISRANPASNWTWTCGG